MDAPPRLLRATLTLLAGGALAQALPLLLGPWLTRLYAPAEFGTYHLFAAVAGTLAVVACARYEFALPRVAGDSQARALSALCLWLLLPAAALSALAGLGWAWWVQAPWPLWLPLAVALLCVLSLAVMGATRALRFHALAIARVVKHGGGAVLQGVAGLLQAGVTGLIVGPLLAVAATVAGLGLPSRGGRRVGRRRLLAMARQQRDFPLLNTPHAFAGAAQDALALMLIAASQGPVAAGFWGLTLRYLKAPATLVGGAVSQVLYPQLMAHGPRPTAASRRVLRRVMLGLAALAAPLVLLLGLAAPPLFEWAFGADWRGAGELAAALALYTGVHFVASPLGVVTMAWGAQGWALRLALVGQGVFLVALAAGLALGGLQGAGWAVSAAMAVYFGWYVWRLAAWPLPAQR